jgi:hypothetical protein
MEYQAGSGATIYLPRGFLACVNINAMQQIADEIRSRSAALLAQERIANVIIL